MKVDELWNGESFDRVNLNELFQYLTGDESATFETVQTLSATPTSSADIRANVIGEKTDAQDVVVTLGGLEWQVVYLSKDNNENTILTLWLSSSFQDAWADRQVDEGSYYGFINGSLYSDWSANWSLSLTDVSYPGNMYGTSYIRAVTLNNGGDYAMLSEETQTLETETETATQSENSVFALFTMEEVIGNLTNYLVTPGDVAWQLLQSIDEGIGSSYLYPNDSINDPTGILEMEYYSNPSRNINMNYHSKAGYGAWANDYLWLPSLAETGYWLDNSGIWETSETQRQNISSSTSNMGTVGSDSNGPYSYNDTWVRSGMGNSPDWVYAIDPMGNGGTASHTGYYNPSLTSIAVRPALHLNLNAAYANSIADNLSNAEIELSETSAAFDGTAVERPAVTVRYNGVALVEGEDFEVKIFDESGEEVEQINAVGTYTITAIGTEDATNTNVYIGSVSAQFVVYQKITEITFENDSTTVVVTNSNGFGQNATLNVVLIIDEAEIRERLNEISTDGVGKINALYILTLSNGDEPITNLADCTIRIRKDALFGDQFEIFCQTGSGMTEVEFVDDGEFVILNSSTGVIAVASPVSNSNLVVIIVVSVLAALILAAVVWIVIAYTVKKKKRKSQMTQ